MSGPNRVQAPSPPMKATRLWSAAAERDEQVETTSLLGSPSHATASIADPPMRTPPRVASKPACLPALKNTGPVDCRDGVDDDDKGGKHDDDVEELVPRGGVGLPASTVRLEAARCSKKCPAVRPLLRPALVARPLVGWAGGPAGGGGASTAGAGGEGGGEEAAASGARAASAGGGGAGGLAPRYGIRMRVHDRYRQAQSRSAKQKSKRKALQ